MPWNPPALQLKWGPYFREDVGEQVQVVTMTVNAYKGGVVTKQQAVEKLAPIYGTDDVDAVIKQLDQESAERQQRAMEQAQASKPDKSDKPPEGEGEPKEP